MKVFAILAYDISSNRRRNKVAKLLETYGERVNYSVFELFLSAKQIDQVVQELHKLIQNKSDKVIVYKLCRKCIDSKIEIGRIYAKDNFMQSIVFH